MRWLALGLMMLCGVGVCDLFCTTASAVAAEPAQTPSAIPLGSPGLWLHVVRELPRTEAAIIAAHEAAASRACLQVPAGQPLQETCHKSAVPLVQSAAQPVEWNDCARLGLFHLGAQMMPDDLGRLPRLTANIVRQKLLGTYVSVQVGSVRDATGEAYLVDRPLAAVGSYKPRDQENPKTQEFAALTEQGVQQLRSIGMVVPAGVEPEPRHLRTLALLHKSTIARQLADNTTELVPLYEWMFVRARSRDAAAGTSLDIHGFATSQERRQLHYFPPYQPPGAFENCAIQSTIFFTKLGGFAGLQPAERATRQVDLHAQRSYQIEDLNRWLAQQGLQGDVFDHLTLVLDAIIDGRVTASSPSVATDVTAMPVRTIRPVVAESTSQQAAESLGIGALGAKAFETEGQNANGVLPPVVMPQPASPAVDAKPNAMSVSTSETVPSPALP